MKKIYNIKVSTLIMIFLPILSILIGYFGVKLYLLSNNNFNDEIDSNRPGVEEIIENNDVSSDESLTTEEDSNNEISENETSNLEKRVTQSIGPINYYSIQVGSFSDEENANEFRNELTDKGYFAYNLSDNNYKVFIAASYNKDMLAEELASIKEISPDAFIKSMNIKSKNFSYTIKENDYFKEISTSISNQINTINASINLQNIKEDLNKIEKNNSQFKAVNGNNDMSNQITAYVNEIKNAMETVDIDNEDSIQGFLENNINTFIKYFR
ncbi:MAG TPA: SPOR domain-containing protein [Clostridia bacterium]|nr:SPOR domain-containing protein [Clostridia bacterium]